MWTGDEAREETVIVVNGASTDLVVGDTFTTAVVAAAKDAGLGKFRVILDGTEIDPEDAPDTIVEGMTIELQPFDVAG